MVMVLFTPVGGHFERWRSEEPGSGSVEVMGFGLHLCLGSRDIFNHITCRRLSDRLRVTFDALF